VKRKCRDREQQGDLDSGRTGGGQLAEEAAGQDRVDGVGVHPAQRVDLVDRHLAHVRRPGRDVGQQHHPSGKLLLPLLKQPRVVGGQIDVRKIVVLHGAPRAHEVDAHAAPRVQGDRDVLWRGRARPEGLPQGERARAENDPVGRDS